MIHDSILTKTKLFLFAKNYYFSYSVCVYDCPFTICVYNQFFAESGTYRTVYFDVVMQSVLFAKGKN